MKISYSPPYQIYNRIYLSPPLRQQTHDKINYSYSPFYSSRQTQPKIVFDVQDKRTDMKIILSHIWYWL